jgi:hypothetical protein
MKTDQLIDKLKRDLKPVQKSVWAADALLLWLLVSCAVVGLALFVLPIRPDLRSRLPSTYFQLETILCIGACMSAVLIAYRSSIPGLLGEWEEKLGLLLLLLMGGALMSKMMLLGLHPDLSLKHEFLMELDFYRGRCGQMMLIIGMVGASALTFISRRNAPTKLYRTGLWVALAAGCLALTAMQFVCDHENFAHIFLWHMVPVMLLALGGAALGKKILRW